MFSDSLLNWSVDKHLAQELPGAGSLSLRHLFRCPFGQQATPRATLRAQVDHSIYRLDDFQVMHHHPYSVAGVHQALQDAQYSIRSWMPGTSSYL
jgi:hypothetical protein